MLANEPKTFFPISRLYIPTVRWLKLHMYVVKTNFDHFLTKMGRFESIFKNLFSDLQQEGTCIIWPKTIPLRPGSFQKMQRFYRKIRDDHSRKVPSIYYVSILKDKGGPKLSK